MLERDIEATAATLGSDGERWTKWMSQWPDRWEGLCEDALAPLGIPSHPFWMAEFGLSAFRAATSLARGKFKEEPARALFAGLAGHSVIPLDMSPSAAIGVMLGIAGHAVGWPMPRGGSGSIASALASKLRSLGGEIITDTTVTDLEQVPTDGPILFETAPARLVDIAGDALPLSYRRKLQAYRHGPGVFTVSYTHLTLPTKA